MFGGKCLLPAETSVQPLVHLCLIVQKLPVGRVCLGNLREDGRESGEKEGGEREGGKGVTSEASPSIAHRSFWE